MRQLKGKRATVMGLGRFGGGVGVARFLLAQGAVVTVTDEAGEDKLRESVAAVGDGAAYHLGGHRSADFTDTDLVVANPAVKPNSEWLRLAREAGVEITTEINLFFERCRGRIIGVTGSVGKTTTASMIGHALAGPRTWLGGNIGRSLLSELDKITPDGLVVLELSSAQLYWLGPTGRAPNVSVVTNITTNHIDWHGSMPEYVRAKKSAVANQSAGDVAVLNHDDEVLRAWAGDCKSRALFWSTREELAEGVFVRDGRIVARSNGRETVVLETRKMTVPGAHNVENAAAAVAACMTVNAPLDKVGKALTEFEGAEHRLEFVREVNGVRYYNDSKATTPVSSLAALRSFEQPTVLILGGRNKGISYDELADELDRFAHAGRCRSVVLMGEMAEPLDRVLTTRAPRVDRVRAGSFNEAVRTAAGRAKRGDVVLLSPACTSFDMFNNFEERGRAFKEAVARL